MSAFAEVLKTSPEYKTLEKAVKSIISNAKNCLSEFSAFRESIRLIL